jgi:hypothetical protein
MSILEDDLAANHGRFDFGVENPFCRHRTQVLIDDDQIGKLSNLDRPLFLFIPRQLRRLDRIQLDCLLAASM